MSLKELQFTDLLISSGNAHLRGVPGEGIHLIQVPDDCMDEIREMQLLLREAWMAKKMNAIRFQHKDVIYRVSRAPDIAFGDCWFLRRMPTQVPTLEMLGVPQHIGQWLTHEKLNHGLTLFSGSQGSGKTTLASALIKTRLSLYGGLAVTFESPAEMPLSGTYGDFGQCIQTELLTEDDLPTMIQRSHMFGQPNIIFIGEIKSAVAAMEALRASLGSKEQMVVATIHGTNLISALQRLLLWGKELDGSNAAMNLGMSLCSIIQLSLETEGTGKKLHVPEFLMVPYDGELSTAIRAKIKSGVLTSLEGEMNRIKNLILHGGSGVNSLLK